MKIEGSYVIAEIGVNYYDIAKKENISVMDAAKLMIKKAKEAGADAAKFQSYKAQNLASKNSPAYWDTSKETTKSQYELFQKFDLFGEDEYIELYNYCNKIGIDFLSTPFDLEAVDFLNPLMKYFKIASADITNYPLLKKIAEKDKPIFISTGASTIDEIKKSVDYILSINSQADINLLHCVLSYPTKNEDANLKRISYLKKEFPDFTIGYSDHTVPDKNLLILALAYSLGAKILEKHFTLDKKLQGNDHYHAMDVNDLIQIRHNLSLVDLFLQKDEKNFLKCEEIPRLQARRSIVLNKNINKGEIITDKDIIMKRPGSGISPTKIYQILGRKVSKDLSEDYVLKEEDLE